MRSYPSPGTGVAASLAVAALGAGVLAAFAWAGARADGPRERGGDAVGPGAAEPPAAGPAARRADGGSRSRARFLAPSPGGASPLAALPPDLPEPREFFFTRAVYSSRGMWGRRSWSTDYPKADRQFLVVLKRLTNLDAYDDANAVRLSDPGLRRFPFLYALEVGYMTLTAEEIEGLRGYLEAGGFLMVDDFWGSHEWANFEVQMARVFPDRPIEDIPMDHPLFDAFYEIEEVKQVPNVRNGRMGGRTWERDGRVPRVRGITDDKGRLMVVINWNTDLGDAWEWAEDPFYPLEYSTYAFEMAVNQIVYAMTH